MYGPITKNRELAAFFLVGTSSMNSKLTGESDGVDGVKKNIAIFAYKLRLLSIEMKTKLVQHVPRINLSHFKF